MVIISTFTEPLDGLKHQQPCVRVIFNDKDIGKGLLYINDNVLAWQNDTNPQVGFCIEYPHISLHALSRDPASYPFPCIYIMLDGHAQLPGDCPLNESNGIGYAHDDQSSDSETDSVADITEVRLVPDDVESLETIFNAIRLCQELNPDPNESMSDEEEYYDGEYFVGGEGDMFEDDEMEPDSDRLNALNINGGGAGDAPVPSDNEAFEDAD